MDEHAMQRIFKPFFTTGKMERGTDLETTSAYGMIGSQGGGAEMERERSYGAVFRMYLPTSDREIPGEAGSSTDVSTGRKTILLVDDEDINIEVVREILELLGYSVLAVQRGRDAVDLYRQKKTLIDLVILDMIMPGMGGGDTFDALIEINPDVKVVLSSGYSLHGEALRIMERGCSAFIQKPFRIEELAGKLAEVLGGKQ